MGLGGYLAARTDRRANSVKRSARKWLTRRCLTEKRLVDLMMRFEPGFSEAPDPRRARQSAATSRAPTLCNGARSFPALLPHWHPGQTALFSPSENRLQSGPEESRARQQARRSVPLMLRTALRGSRRGRRARQILGLNPVRSAVKIVARYKHCGRVCAALRVYADPGPERRRPRHTAWPDGSSKLSAATYPTSP